MRIYKKIILFFLIIIAIICLVILKDYNKYDENRQMYLVLKSEDFNIYSYTKGNNKYINKKDIKDIIKKVEKEYIDIADRLSIDFKGKIDILIYGSSDELRKSLGVVDEKFNVRGYGGLGDIRIVIDENERSKDDIVSLITHELVHVITMDKNPEIEKHLWLLEGLATYYANQITDKEKSLIYMAAKYNSLPSLEEINSKPYDITIRWNYSIYYSIIDYIVNNYGEEKLIRIIDFLGKESVFEQIETSENEFYNGWIKYLKDYYN